MLPWRWTHRMRSRLLWSPPGKRRSRPCTLPSGCSCWRRTPRSSPLPRSPGGTGRFRWRRGPGRSSHSGSGSGSSHRQCRPPRTHTRRPGRGLGPSSLQGSEAPSSCRRQSHGRTRTRLRCTLPGPSSRPGNGARSSSCPSTPRRTRSRTRPCWRCRDRCSAERNPGALEEGENTKHFKQTCSCPHTGTIAQTRMETIIRIHPILDSKLFKAEVQSSFCVWLFYRLDSFSSTQVSILHLQAKQTTHSLTDRVVFQIYNNIKLFFVLVFIQLWTGILCFLFIT